MKKLVLLVVVLALCMPSYGTVLVYKLVQTYNPVIDFDDENENTADLLKKKVEVFIVFDANVTSDYHITVEGDDADVPAAVLVFKSDKKFILLGGSDPNSEVTIGNYPSDNTIAPFTALNKRNAKYTDLDITLDDPDNNFNMSAFDLFGKNTSADIGLADKVVLAKSLKGYSEIQISEAGDFYGFGSAKLTLDSRYTKTASKLGFTVAQTVAAITLDLDKKHITETQTVPRD